MAQDIIAFDIFLEPEYAIMQPLHIVVSRIFDICFTDTDKVTCLYTKLGSPFFIGAD